MIRTCCFSKDDKLLAFGDYNGSINIFATIAPFEVLYDFETPLGIMNLRFTNDGALIGGDHGGNLKCWRFQSVAVQNFFKKAACGNPQKGKIYAKADIKWESGLQLDISSGDGLDAPSFEIFSLKKDQRANFRGQDELFGNITWGETSGTYGETRC
jgi:hypothetical protein